MKRFVVRKRNGCFAVYDTVTKQYGQSWKLKKNAVEYAEELNKATEKQNGGFCNNLS